MYYCKTCNYFYDDEYVPEWEEADTGYIHRECPNCGDDLYPASQCPCGNHISPDESFCTVCQEKADLALDTLLDDLAFSDEDFESLIYDYLERKEER